MLQGWVRRPFPPLFRRVRLTPLYTDVSRISVPLSLVSRTSIPKRSISSRTKCCKSGELKNAKRPVFKYFTWNGVVYTLTESIKMVSEELWAIENETVANEENGLGAGANEGGNPALTKFIAERKREIAERHEVRTSTFILILV